MHQKTLGQYLNGQEEDNMVGQMENLETDVTKFRKFILEAKLPVSRPGVSSYLR